MSLLLIENQSQVSGLKESLRAKDELVGRMGDEQKRLAEALSHTQKAKGAYAKALVALRTRQERHSAIRKELEDKCREIDTLRDLLTEAKRRYAVLETLMDAEHKAVSEKIAMLSDLKTQLFDSHKVLSSKALQENNVAFLDLARTTMEKYMETARNDLESKALAVKALLQPLQESLAEYRSQVKAMEMAREKAYGGLAEQLIALSGSQENLLKETGKLSRALRSPHVRGRWGEITLRRVVELAGMQNRCDFFEQPLMGSAGEKHRPDMIIHLPGNRRVIVDSKVPMNAYLDAMEMDSERERNEKLDHHAKQLRAHILQLAQKSYWEAISPTPEFVVMFIPGESFLAAALSINPRLIESGASRNVILATPTTLIALLKSVALGWRQESLMENAHRISQVGAQFYERLSTLTSHVNRLGHDLTRCVASYNQMTGAFTHRVMPAAKRFEEMEIGKGPLQLEPVQTVPEVIETER
jgi:DNA recombination protein RmuC